MPTLHISGISEDEKKALDQAAEDAGMTTSEFCRTRLRAGYRLWDADENFDVTEFQERLNEKQPADSTTSPTPSRSASAGKADRFESQIVNNLPSAEKDAIPKDELTDVVSQKVIDSVLTDLRERGEVKYVIEQDGFIKLK